MSKPNPSADRARPHNSDYERGSRSVIGSTLMNLLQRLSDADADWMEDWLRGTSEDLERLWGPTFTDHQRGVIDEYERLALLVRHRRQFAGSDESTSNEFVIFCLKCETFPIDVDSPCPVCRALKWLHVARI